MKKVLRFGLLTTLLMPALALAQSAFEGTWKIDLNKAEFPKKPDVFLLQDGMYHCKTCVPPFDVKADGQDHKVTGHPYYDTVSITVVDDRTIEESEKKDGKTVITSKTSVAPDGQTATFEFTDASATNAEPVKGNGESTRVEKGPAGSHAISGSWRTTKMSSISDNGLLFTYKVDGQMMTMTTPTGQSYNAKLDGTDAPYTGDPGISSVSVKLLGKETLEESDKRDGKVISIARSTLAADGKTMNVKITDKLHGTTSQFVAMKQ